MRVENKENINDQQGFLSAIEDLEAQKGIKPEILLETLKNALVFAYKKHTGDSSDIVLDINQEKNP